MKSEKIESGKGLASKTGKTVYVKINKLLPIFLALYKIHRLFRARIIVSFGYTLEAVRTLQNKK